MVSASYQPLFKGVIKRLIEKLHSGQLRTIKSRISRNHTEVIIIKFHFIVCVLLRSVKIFVSPCFLRRLFVGSGGCTKRKGREIKGSIKYRSEGGKATKPVTGESEKSLQSDCHLPREDDETHSQIYTLFGRRRVSVSSSQVFELIRLVRFY